MPGQLGVFIRLAPGILEATLPSGTIIGGYSGGEFLSETLPPEVRLNFKKSIKLNRMLQFQLKKKNLWLRILNGGDIMVIIGGDKLSGW